VGRRRVFINFSSFHNALFLAFVFGRDDDFPGAGLREFK
jgi:hypothetical protein